MMSARSGDLQVATSSRVAAWRRKSNRLPREVYKGNHTFHVTLATAGRVPRFRDGEWVRYCEGALASAAEAEGFVLLAYIFMPDHAHILAASGLEPSDLARFVKRFKQETSFAFKRRTGQPLWQKGYYDHVVRGDEDLTGIALYIAGNPVRSGLVDEWIAYPFVGGVLLIAARGGDLKVAASSASA